MDELSLAPVGCYSTDLGMMTLKGQSHKKVGEIRPRDVSLGPN
jgi:hypothetical protein